MTRTTTRLTTLPRPSPKGGPIEPRQPPRSILLACLLIFILFFVIPNFSRCWIFLFGGSKLLLVRSLSPSPPPIDRSSFPPFPKRPHSGHSYPCRTAALNSHFHSSNILISPTPTPLQPSSLFPRRLIGVRETFFSTSGHAQDLQLYGPGPSWLGTNDADLWNVQTTHRHDFSPATRGTSHDAPHEY
jgi:hypothetical protein